MRKLVLLTLLIGACGGPARSTKGSVSRPALTEEDRQAFFHFIDLLASDQDSGNKAYLAEHIRFPLTLSMNEYDEVAEVDRFVDKSFANIDELMAVRGVFKHRDVTTLRAAPIETCSDPVTQDLCVTGEYGWMLAGNSITPDAAYPADPGDDSD